MIIIRSHIGYSSEKIAANCKPQATVSIKLEAGGDSFIKIFLQIKSWKQPLKILKQRDNFKPKNQSANKALKKIKTYLAYIISKINFVKKI